VLSQGRNCLVLTNWIAHLDKLADALRAIRHDPVILRGGMGAKVGAAALARLQPQPGGPPLLAVATGPYAREGFDCPALDTLFLAAPVAQKGRLVQYPGRILRPYDGKATAEVHNYHDELFDAWRSAILLVAGDQAENWTKWYAQMIPRAEQLYEIYLKERAAEEGRQ
jgi:superfamily II DNA or RNA helicase